MQALQQRDEKSVHIFIGLLLGVLLTVVGLVLLWLLDEAFRLSDGLTGDLSNFIVGSGVLLAIVYVYRHRRP